MRQGKTHRNMALVIVAALLLVVGMGIGCVLTKRSDTELQNAAFQQLRGNGNVPGTTEESVGTGNGTGFQPSDSPPKCLPTGTVTYEIYDSAANMRYWVFRWPEGKGYSIVPRLTLNADHELVPYSQPTYSSTKNQTKKTDEETTTTTTTQSGAVTTTGTVKENDYEQ